MSYDSANLTTPDIKWISRQGRICWRKICQKESKWVEELTLMVKSRQKAEIQALSNFGFQYLSEVYLPLKLQEKDWI
ncbi:hypothetical protein M0R45_005310 [Rubus argutus]|uniref:Topoisomerase 6 subunit A/Spo11 TOPRIM domain-containing protein n=1 Tax=Rubus argutus TaxID=59490 RepID=A0AAW1YMA7_RUBAR